MDPHIASVPLDKASRLLNHGPTVLVSARHGGVEKVMAAAWACALDYNAQADCSVERPPGPASWSSKVAPSSLGAHERPG